MVISDYECRRHGVACRPGSVRLRLQRLIRSLAGVYLALLVLTNVAHAASPVLTLSQPASVDELQGHIDYLIDPEWTLTIESATDAGVSERFAPVVRSSPDFGYTNAALWLRFSVANTNPAIEQWRMLFHENFLQVFEVYQIDEDGSVDTLARLDRDSSFEDRPLGTPTLAVPLVLPAGASATIFIRYSSGGSSEVSWSIESEESFNAFEAKTTAKNFIYYGMMVILIIIALFSFLMSRKPVFIAYAAYSTSALLYIVHSDGNGFKYLWPNSPQFNSYASIALGSSLIVFGAVFAMIFLQTRRYHPIMDKMLGGVIVLTLGMIAASAFVDNLHIKKSLVLIAFLAITLFVASGLVAARHRFKEVRFYVIAWTGAVASSAIMTSRHWFGVEISEQVQFDSMRIVMVTDAALMGLAIWDYFNQLRQARQAALKASLDTSVHNLELSNRLQNLEEHYAIALDMADQQGRQFVDTIHDLNQPLHALRLDMRRLLSSPSADTQSRKRVEETLAYLESLVTDHLDRSITDVSLKEKHLTDPGGEDQLSVGDILGAIREMFDADAKEKGLELHYVPTSLTTRIEPLVLMRIVTNLVANAIKYTNQGRILVGCRRNGQSVSIEVHDTGLGMTQQDFQKAVSRAVRLEAGEQAAEGHGLGLSIACKIAEENGFGLKMASNQSGGSSFKLVVPAASAASGR